MNPPGPLIEIESPEIADPIHALLLLRRFPNATKPETLKAALEFLGRAAGRDILGRRLAGGLTGREWRAEAVAASTAELRQELGRDLKPEELRAFQSAAFAVTYDHV